MRATTRGMLGIVLGLVSMLTTTAAHATHESYTGTQLTIGNGGSCDLNATCGPFVHSGCKQELATTTGAEGIVLDVSASMAGVTGSGRTAKVKVSAAQVGGYPSAMVLWLQFHKADCLSAGDGDQVDFYYNTPFSVFVPRNTKWIVAWYTRGTGTSTPIAFRFHCPTSGSCF